MKRTNEESLHRLMQTILTPQNSERLHRIFYDAAKIVCRRQDRLDKPQLKMKEISSAIALADSLNSNLFRFEAVGQLAECFGGRLCEEQALRYYEQRVMGEVTDRAGRKVVLDESGMRSLYKERGSGRHIVASENYEEVRGKRLPWIRHTIQNCDSIFIQETVGKSFRRSFLYAGVASIPVSGKSQISYYVVIVREEKNKNYGFVTAYSMFGRNDFLRVIENSHPERYP